MTGSVTGARRAARAECEPARVAAVLDELWTEYMATPVPDEGGWGALAEYSRWLAGWHDRTRVQWGRLHEWALVTAQPAAVARAIVQAEHCAATRALRAEAQAAERDRRAAKATTGTTGMAG